MKTACFALIFLISFFNADLSFASSPDTTQTAPPAVQVSAELTLSTGNKTSKVSENVHQQSLPVEFSGYVNLVMRTGWTIPVQMLWSSKSYHTDQSYNQIGVSPRYKELLTLHGGYRSVTFSPLTLAGHRFLGAGVELNPGLLRAGFVAGKFNRAIEKSDTDPYRRATFKRPGYAARLGVGNQRTYLDLILVQIADDTSSIRTDTSANAPRPADNIVVGISGRMQIQKKWVLELDAAGSAYTPDTRLGESAEFNSTISPPRFDSRIDRLKKIVAVRPTTDLRMAVRAALSYRGQWTDLKIRYRLTEPGYRSMGGYYFQQDFENMTVAPSFRLFKKTIELHTSVGWQRDNLANQKKARTDRLISSAMISYTSPRDLTLDLSISNYGITQRAGYRPLDDTTHLAQNDLTLSGNLWKLWTGRTATHTLTASATFQKLHDRNLLTIGQNHYENRNFALNYALQQGAAGWDSEVGLSYTQTEAQDFGSLFYGLSLSVEKRMLAKDKLRIRLSATCLRSNETIDDQTQAGIIVNTTLSVGYQLTARQQLRFYHDRSLSTSYQRYLQHQGNIQWSFSF